MPSYEFACDDCQLIEKVIRKYEDRERELLCPECGKPMTYMFPAPTFHFEGGSPSYKEKYRVKSKEQFLEGMDDDV